MATSQPKILHLRKKRHSKEYYRRATFLTACMNFKSCEENAMLLLYGYTREKTKNISLYKYIPDDLMHLIYTICYKEKKFYEGNNHNHWDEKSIDKLNKLTEHEGYTKMELNDSKDIIKIYSNDNSLQTIVATNRITNSRIRKVWRLKILETSNKNINENISMRISFLEYNTYNIIRGKPKKFDLICDEELNNNIMVKQSDLITVLFINTRGKNKLSQCAINDKIYPCKEIKGEVMQLHGRRYRLAITVQDNVVIELLN